MRKVRCIDCGKTYDYDEDGFCPRCGTFNQPSQRASGVTIQTPKRKDGLSEAGHSGSFLHREYHTEEWERRSSGLERDQERRQTADHRQSSRPPARETGAGTKGKPTLGKIIRWIILIYILFGLLTNLLGRMIW